VIVATVTEAKNRLSALLDRVRAGETVLIVDRGVPVARLESAVATEPDELDGRLARLERAGLIRRGTGRLPGEIIEKTPPALLRDADVVAMLIEERREGR
jgi:prevent-host-death family protein